MNKKGFTILELVIVISVLVILIGIAIPRIKGMQDQGNIVKAKAELQTLQTGVESFYSNSNPHAYPPASWASDLGQELSTSTPQIISSTLYDPFAATSTQYGYARSGNYYVIWSVGSAIASYPGISGGINSNGLVYWNSGGTGLCVTNGTGC